MFPAFAAEDLSAKISAAKTAADHEALAAEFDKGSPRSGGQRSLRMTRWRRATRVLGKTGQYHADSSTAAAIASNYRTQAKPAPWEASTAERAAAKAAVTCDSCKRGQFGPITSREEGGEQCVDLKASWFSWW